MLDHEKLDVYQAELRFMAWTNTLLNELEGGCARSVAHIVDHLRRASLSALLNTAEGNGKRQRPVRARFFDDARGSAAECAACLDALVSISAVDAGRVAEGKDLVVRIVSMLTKLVSLYSARQGRVRENGAPYDLDAECLAHVDAAGPARLDEDDDEDDDERVNSPDSRGRRQ